MLSALAASFALSLACCAYGVCCNELCIGFQGQLIYVLCFCIQYKNHIGLFWFEDMKVKLIIEDLPVNVHSF